MEKKKLYMWVIVVVVLAFLAYYYYYMRKPAAAPAKKALGAPSTQAGTSLVNPTTGQGYDLDANGQPINSGGYLVNPATGALITDADGNPVLGAGVAG